MLLCMFRDLIRKAAQGVANIQLEADEDDNDDDDDVPELGSTLPMMFFVTAGFSHTVC